MGFVGGEVEDEGISVDVGLAAEICRAGGAIVLDCSLVYSCCAGEAVVDASYSQFPASGFYERAVSCYEVSVGLVARKGEFEGISVYVGLAAEVGASGEVDFSSVYCALAAVAALVAGYG